MQIIGEVTILKDNRGICKVGIANKELQADGTEVTKFMRMNIGFRKGIEVKNKSKINIKDGFLTFFRIETDQVNENGDKIYKSYPKIMVMDFEVIEEGTDEVYQHKEYTTTQETEVGSEFVSDDELPF